MIDRKPEATENFRIDSLDFLTVKEIHPASPQEIKAQIDKAYNFAANAEVDVYGRGRGANRILVPGRDYAELPGFAGKSPREIIEALPAGSTVLDVGCGYGQLGAEIMGTVGTNTLNFDDKNAPPINKKARVYGFDAQAQKGQNRLTRIVIGNIDDLSPSSFGGDPDNFDLVISSSVLYHLPDYWGSLLRMANVLKPKGTMLATTMPRVIIPGYYHAVEDEKGYLVNPDGVSVAYYRNRNVFDVNGKLIPPGELVDILNQSNPHFRLQYGVASTKQMGALTHGGQISGQRLSAMGNLDLSSMFYCLSKDDLGYIVAHTPEDNTLLQKAGYANLHDRLP